MPKNSYRKSKSTKRFQFSVDRNITSHKAGANTVTIESKAYDSENGKAKSKAQLSNYFKQYQKKSPAEFLYHCFERESVELVRKYVGSNTKAFEWAKKFYLIFNSPKKPGKK